MEFIFASTVLLIPMVYLILAAGQLQGGSYAVVGAADHAAKVFAIAQTPAQAEIRCACRRTKDHGQLRVCQRENFNKL